MIHQIYITSEKKKRRLAKADPLIEFWWNFLSRFSGPYNPSRKNDDTLSWRARGSSPGRGPCARRGRAC